MRLAGLCSAALSVPCRRNRGEAPISKRTTPPTTRCAARTDPGHISTYRMTPPAVLTALLSSC